MNINNNEILFWKIIRNIYLFKIILFNISRYQIDTIGSSLRPIYSIKWLIKNGYRNTLKYKLLNDHYLELDCKTYEFNIFSFLSPIKNNQKTKDYDELVFFNFFKRFYNSIIPGHRGDSLLNHLISVTVNSNNIPAFKVLCKEKYGYNYYLNPLKFDLILDSNSNSNSLHHCKTLNKVRKLLYKNCNSSGGSGSGSVNEFFICKNNEIKIWDEISNCFLKEVGKQLLGISRNSFSTKHIHINQHHKPFSEGLSQCLIENDFFNCICTYIKLYNFFLIKKGINPPSNSNHPFYKSFKIIYEFCPLSSDFKVEFLLNICKSISIIIKSTNNQNCENKNNNNSDFILTIEKLNSMEFDKKLLKLKISMVESSIKNVELLLKMFLTIREITLNISSPLYYYKYYKQTDYDNFQHIEKIDKNINSFNGCEVSALRFANFDLLSRWYQVMNQYISPKLDLVYCNNKNINLKEDSFGNLIKKSTNSSILNEVIKNGFFGSSTRLLELFETTTPLLFNKCFNRSNQIQFINQVCNEIKFNFDKFKLHPIIFLQLIIQYNDFEFVKITFKELESILKHDTILKMPANILYGFRKNANGCNWDRENNFYNINNIFKRVKSIEIYEFILNNFKGFSFLHDWFSVKEMIIESFKSVTIPNILNNEIITNTNSISLLEYYFNKTGSIKDGDQIYLFKKPMKQIPNEFFNYLKYIVDNCKSCNINYNLYFMIHYIKKFNGTNQIKLFEFFTWVDIKGMISFNTPQLTLHQILQNGIQTRIEMEDVFKYIVASFKNDNELLTKRFFSPFETLDKFTHRYSLELSKFMEVVINNKDFNIINLIMLNYFNRNDNDNSTSDHQNLLFYVKHFIGDQYNIKILYYLLESHNYSFLKYIEKINNPYFIDLKNSLTINEFNYLYNQK
ncbi:hypothetical protein DDB_G0288695 [Dictyostelium discoideum AX4]|uniref:Uncharacterized protein n=1 Tax=Dictyostelium discoideum TaxID=44689 RepID=Q54IK4_DICDI|nr:hypothetical protein DDB_G0288695 [Dictyostelium discoideum AX4]EAL63079.1 hypothetical protein DDB_G0288695 [Dictyostelium discoideum AX4]|eukprot:XP_636582.1 hypothetical protein DDB_G0288695 [Dictyostelium discoideum AX4]